MEKDNILNKQLKHYWFVLLGAVIIGIFGLSLLNSQLVVAYVLLGLAGFFLLISIGLLILALVTSVQCLVSEKNNSSSAVVVIAIGIILSFFAGIGTVVLIIGHVMLNNCLK